MGMKSSSARTVLSGMLTLALGAGTARLLGLLAMPVLTRLYDASDWAALSVFSALVLVLLPIVSFRYAVALPLPRYATHVINVAAVAMVCLAVMSIILAALMWLLGPPVLSLFSMDVLSPVRWLILLTVFVAGTNEILTMWMTRERRYTVVSRVAVLQSSGTEGLRIGFGLLGLSPIGLLAGQFGGQAISSGVLAWVLRSKIRAGIRHISFRRMLAMAIRHKHLPLMRAPSQLLLVFSIQAPILFTAAFYGPQPTGQLGLAILALALPFNLVGQSTSRAYYAEVSAIGQSNRRAIREVTLAVMLRMIGLALPVSIVIFLTGEALFALVFGEEWRPAGQYASILSLYLAFQFISSPFLQLFNVLRRQEVYLQIYLQRALGVSAVFAIGAIFGFPIVTTLWLYTIFLALHYGVVATRTIHALR